MDSKIIDTKKILSEIINNSNNTYFKDFLTTNTFELGLLKLDPGEKDVQDAHNMDEIYFIIEGQGWLSVDNMKHYIQPGSCVFIPAETPHHFHGNTSRLVVLYVFAIPG